MACTRQLKGITWVLDRAATSPLNILGGAQCLAEAGSTDPVLETNAMDPIHKANAREILRKLPKGVVEELQRQLEAMSSRAPRPKCSGPCEGLKKAPDGYIRCTICGWKRVARLIGSCGEVVREFPHNGSKSWLVHMGPGYDGERMFTRPGPDQRIDEPDKEQVVYLYRETIKAETGACASGHSQVCQNVAEQLEGWKSRCIKAEEEVTKARKEQDEARSRLSELAQLSMSTHDHTSGPGVPVAVRFENVPMKAVRADPEAFLKPDGATSKAKPAKPQRMVIRYSEED